MSKKPVAAIDNPVTLGDFKATLLAALARKRAREAAARLGRVS